MNFWANKLGGQPPAPAVPVVPVFQPQPSLHPGHQPAQRAWWDESPQPQPMVQQPQQQFEVPRQARAHKHMENCPECGSNDFMGDPRTPNARKRCYTCGFPYVQSGSHGIGTGGGGDAMPSRQIHDGSSNYNPQNIFDRIG